MNDPFALLLPLLLLTASQAVTVHVDDHGAKGDGATLDTVAIQAAIQACAAGGGGEVLFGPRRYLSGSLELRSGVTLKLDAKTVLLGSDKIADYPRGSLIRADDCQNVGLEGGTIDGRGDVWWKPARTYTGPSWRGTAQFEYEALKRPSFLRFFRCENVAVRDVLLTGSPSWTLHLNRCKQAVVERVTIRNPLYGPNTDGIDLNSCQQVTVRDCDIITGDDGIVLKSSDPGHDHPSADITVERCRIWSACNALKIGTETHDSFTRIRFAECHLYGGSDKPLERPLSGLAIESVDGAELSDIVAENLTMDNLRAPIFVRLGHRGGNSERTQQVEPRVPGRIRNVVIRNVKAERSNFESSITGMPGHPVEGVRLENVDLGYVGGGEADLALVTVPDLEVVKRYPEAQMFGRLPAYGLYARHVEDLQLHAVTLRHDEPEGRPALVCDDVTGLRLAGVKPQPPASVWPTLWLIGVRQVTIEGCVALPGTGTFLAIEGNEADRGQVVLGDNDLKAARTQVLHTPPGHLIRIGLPLLPETAPGLLVVRPDALKLTTPMTAVEEPEAAPGRAIEVPLGKGRDTGTALGRLTITEPGEYRIWARAWAPDAESNSYWLTIDDFPPALIDVDALGRWAWEMADDREQPGRTYALAAGEHLLTIRNREAGTRLAWLVIAKAGAEFDPAAAVAPSGKQ